jgi:pimeloyl-ACP methyl ester carboxylesterase
MIPWIDNQYISCSFQKQNAIFPLKIEIQTRITSMKKHILALSILLMICGMMSLSRVQLNGEPFDGEIYSREEVWFDSGQFKIVGDLHIPYPDKKQPVIIFVHGDGPASRRPSGEPNQIMSHFLEIGFACFFYDKPGYGESTGKFTNGKLFKERAAILVDAVHVMMKHPAIDPKMIGLWGISQAGWVMPIAIANTKDIAFMIAVSCAGTDGVEQSAYLVEKQVLCDGYDKEEAEKARQYYRQRAHAKTYQEYLEAAEYLNKNQVVSSFLGWGRIVSEDQFSPRSPSNEGFFNPMTIVERTSIPVLAIFGGKDTQVDPFQAYEAYEHALKKAGNPLSQIKLFPDADHIIMLSKTGCMIEQRKRWRARGSHSFAPGFIELMQDWLLKLKEKM